MLFKNFYVQFDSWGSSMRSIKNFEIRLFSEVFTTLYEIYFTINTRIYSLSCGPRIFVPENG